MENEGQTENKEELAPAELRKKVVADFARDVSQGRILLSIDQQRWRQQDVDLISSTAGGLMRDLADYVSGSVAGEEFEFLEKQIFFAISVLRTYDAVKSNFSESRAEEAIRKLEAKADRLDEKVNEILQVLRSIQNQETPQTKSKDRKAKPTRKAISFRNKPPAEPIDQHETKKEGAATIIEGDEGVF